MWSLASSNCATAKTSSSLAKPMRLQEPSHTSAQVEGQRNGCMHEKEQVSHYLTAIQHYCSTSLVTSLCLVLTKNDQGYREGSGVTDLLPLPLPSSTLTHNPQGLPLTLLLPTLEHLSHEMNLKETKGDVEPALCRLCNRSESCQLSLTVTFCNQTWLWLCGVPGVSLYTM